MKHDGHHSLLISPLLAAFALSLLTVLVSAQTPSKGGPVNDRDLASQRVFHPPPYDSHPAFALGANGAAMAVWHSYAEGAEWVVGRNLSGGARAAMIDIATGQSVVTPAEIAVSNSGEFCVTWSALVEGHWRVMTRRCKDSVWLPIEAVSSAGADAVSPVVGADANGQFRLAWSEAQEDGFAVMTAVLGAEAPPLRVSEPGTHAFRPVLSRAGGHETWIVWDAYRDACSAVYARRLTPALSPVELVSDSLDRCLKAAAMATAAGELHVAWVKATDVVGGEGAIDQMHAIEMSRRVDGRWQMVRNERGGTELVSLAHGLLAKMEPRPSPTGGYLGRRRDPMLARDGNDLWLLWERKTDHTGGTSVVTGDLCGMRLSAGQMTQPLLLAQGWVDYRVPHDAELRDGRLELMAASLPRHAMRDLVRLSVATASGRAMEIVDWQGWSRVTLPPEGVVTPPQEIEEQGETFRLYWMDSHVHSALSADAEGEPDEILLYARDRGRLDAVVMQENDFYNAPLTESEYHLGAFFSRVLSQDGSFVAMPGFEWTQQRPSDEGLRLDQPRFWGANYPNHRTIIYPRAGGPLVRYTDVKGDISQLHQAVAAAGGVMHTQHPTFDVHTHPVETAIEVTAGWGVYFQSTRRIHAALDQGLRAGFVGTSDSHRRNPGLGGGLTGIYARDLTPDALLEAYRARRVFATTGSRVALEARANGVLMGSEVAAAAGSAELVLRVNAPRPLRRAVLVIGGAEAASFDAAANTHAATFSHMVANLEPGLHWYYWRVELQGGTRHYGGNVMEAQGHLAWSSPHWLKVGSK